MAMLANVLVFLFAACSFVSLFFLEPFNGEAGLSMAMPLLVLKGFLLPIYMVYLLGRDFCKRDGKNWIESSFWFMITAGITAWEQRAKYDDTAFFVFLTGLIGLSFMFMYLTKPKFDYGILDTILFALLGVARKKGTVYHVLGCFLIVFLKVLRGLLSEKKPFSRCDWPTAVQKKPSITLRIACYIAIGLSIIPLFFLEKNPEEGAGLGLAMAIVVSTGFELAIYLIFIDGIEQILEYCRRSETGWVEDVLWFILTVLLTEWAEMSDYSRIPYFIFLTGLYGLLFVFNQIAKPKITTGVSDTILYAFLGIPEEEEWSIWVFLVVVILLKISTSYYIAKPEVIPQQESIVQPEERVQSSTEVVCEQIVISIPADDNAGAGNEVMPPLEDNEMVKYINSWSTFNRWRSFEVIWAIFGGFFQIASSYLFNNSE